MNPSRNMQQNIRYNKKHGSQKSSNAKENSMFSLAFSLNICTGSRGRMSLQNFKLIYNHWIFNNYLK